MIHSRFLPLSVIASLVVVAAPVLTEGIADIAVQNSTPAEVQAGAKLKVGARITNNGTDVAVGSFVAVPIPEGLAFVSGKRTEHRQKDPHCRVDKTGTRVICGAGAIQSGQTKEFKIFFETDGVPCDTEIATVAKGDARQEDPNTANNTSADSTVVVCNEENV